MRNASSKACLKKMRIKVSPRNIFWIRYILEGYDNLYFQRTLDKQQGILEISFSYNCDGDLIDILNDLSEVIGLEYYESL